VVPAAAVIYDLTGDFEGNIAAVADHKNNQIACGNYCTFLNTKDAFNCTCCCCYS
jgi:hypothetical protein